MNTVIFHKDTLELLSEAEHLEDGSMLKQRFLRLFELFLRMHKQDVFDASSLESASKEVSKALRAKRFSNPRDVQEATLLANDFDVLFDDGA